jgi:RimJ/RimL family protein N-acetyltransferase
MSPAAFVEFQRSAIESYARQNVASGRWPAERAFELSEAEHRRLLPEGPATKDAYLFEICESATNSAVGTLWLAVQETTGTRTGYVYNVEIAEEHRGKGHARRAFEALEPFCRNLGLATIGLHVFAFNAPARRLYEALGYEVTGIHMRKRLG